MRTTRYCDLTAHIYTMIVLLSFGVCLTANLCYVLRFYMKIAKNRIYAYKTYFLLLDSIETLSKSAAKKCFVYCFLFPSFFKGRVILDQQNFCSKARSKHHLHPLWNIFLCLFSLITPLGIFCQRLLKCTQRRSCKA